MKKLFCTALTISILLLFGCSGKQEPAQVTNAAMVAENVPANPLVGTWKLVSYKYGKDTEFSDMTDMMDQIKLITDSHFTWASYDEEEMMGAGGGTYTWEEGKYVEQIDFFHPKGDGMAGSTQVFECELDGDRWIHRGYIKHYELDAETLDFVLSDSSRLEEVWVRIKNEEKAL